MNKKLEKMSIGPGGIDITMMSFSASIVSAFEAPEALRRYIQRIFWLRIRKGPELGLLQAIGGLVLGHKCAS